MRRAAVALFGLCASATVNAQQSVDIVRVCTPILYKATIASVSDVTKTKFFAHYVTLLYSKRTEDVEKVQKEGFDLSVPVDGVPIKALWSKNSDEKRKAESIFSRFVDNTLLKDDIRQYNEVKDNSFATADYNKCVSTMISNTTPNSCFWSSVTERDRAVFNVVFRPTFVINNSKVRIAQIQNGFMLPSQEKLDRIPEKQKAQIEQALERISRGERIRSAPPGTSTRLILDDGRIDAGVHSFNIFRLDPDRSTSVNLQWEVNLACNEAVGPVARSSISVAIWPTGKDWTSSSDRFEYSVTSGCGPGGDVAKEFCTTDGGRITSISEINPYSMNCASAWKGVVRKPGSDSCVIATATVGGCGFTRPWKTCRGRGWVKSRFTLNKEIPGKIYSPERSLHQHEIAEANWTKLFEYTGQPPANFEADGWKFNVEIKRQTSAGVETYVLTDGSPEQGECGAMLHSSNKTGRVVVSCGPQRGLSAGLLLSQ